VTPLRPEHNTPEINRLLTACLADDNAVVVVTSTKTSGSFNKLIERSLAALHQIYRHVRCLTAGTFTQLHLMLR